MQTRLTLGLAALAAGLTGCHSSGGGGGADGGVSTPPPIASAACKDSTAPITITDPTNYTLSDSFSIKTYTLKDNSDLVFDWSALNTDFFGKSMSPTADVDLIMVALWRLTPSQIEEDLKVDNIPLSANAGVITALPDGSHTSVDLSQFTLLGQSIPTDLIPMYFDTRTPNYQYPQNEYTFMMMAATGTTPGKGARGIALFHIDPAASDSTLRMTNDSTKLSYSVSLRGAAPVEVPTGKAQLTLDWSQMKVNMLGNPYVPSQITRAAVAHFKSATLDQLEAKFLDLETTADAWYATTSIAGSSVDLSTLASAQGGAFPGIDDTGVWMTALFCDNCNNPAPWSITILQPCQ